MLRPIANMARAQTREANVSVKTAGWIAGGALGVGVLGYLMWRHFRAAPTGGGPEGTGEPGTGEPPHTGPNFPTPPPKGTFGGPTGPHGHIGQGQGGGVVKPPTTISQTKLVAARTILCNDPGQIQPEEAGTILRAYVLPAWRTVMQGELAPSAGQLDAARDAVAAALQDVCGQPVSGLGTVIGQFADAADAIDSGSRYAQPISATTAIGRVCAWGKPNIVDGIDEASLPLSTFQSLTLIVDVGLDSLRHGGDRFSILERVSCHSAGSVSHVFITASQIANAAIAIHEEMLA